jgi:hypothetical protein
MLPLLLQLPYLLLQLQHTYIMTVVMYRCISANVWAPPSDTVYRHALLVPSAALAAQTWSLDRLPLGLHVCCCFDICHPNGARMQTFGLNLLLQLHTHHDHSVVVLRICTPTATWVSFRHMDTLALLGPICPQLQYQATSRHAWTCMHCLGSPQASLLHVLLASQQAAETCIRSSSTISVLLHEQHSVEATPTKQRLNKGLGDLLLVQNDM